jgi:hypothetical protein
MFGVQFKHKSLGQFFTTMIIQSIFFIWKQQHLKVVKIPTKLKTI